MSKRIVVTKKNCTCEFYNRGKYDNGIQKLINLREKVSSEERKDLAWYYSVGIGGEVHVYGNVSAVSFRHIARRHQITCVVQKIILSFLLNVHFYAFGPQPFGRLLYLSPSHLVLPCIT